SQSVDARYGVYDTESDALDAMLAYGADGRQVAVYTNKASGKTVVKVYNEVLHQLEPLDPEVYELIAEGAGVTLLDNEDGTFSLISSDSTVLATINKANLTDNGDGTYTFNNTGDSSNDIILDFNKAIEKSSEQWNDVELDGVGGDPILINIDTEARFLNITDNTTSSSLGGYTDDGGSIPTSIFWSGMTVKVHNATG